MDKGVAPGAMGVARGRGGRRSGGGGRVPAVERNPERLVREHLQVGGEAVGALDIGHLQSTSVVGLFCWPSMACIHPIE